MPSFAALGVPARLADSLAHREITAPFPIQAATLPDTLAGRDVLGRGRTGSGKTLAFALPLIARLARLTPGSEAIAARSRAGHPRGLVLAPTRELANQILATIAPLAQAAGLTAATIFGGVNQRPQVQQLRRGVDIIVATPGRLEDLMSQGEAHLSEVAITVIDEADHMADLGFLPVVTRILGATPTGQRMLFSATLDNGVDRLVRRFLTDPVQHSTDSEQSPVAAMTHHVFLVADPAGKREIVRVLAGGEARRLLFTRTKHQARKLARELTADGIPAVELHGNLSQNARERGLKAFASGEVRVMVATDIAARGIHVDEVDLVVHVDPPAEHKAYLHRSGRTARAGHAGDVATLVLPEQRRDFQALARAARITVQPAPVTASDPALLALVGDTADRVDPATAPTAAASRPTAGVNHSGSRSRSSGTTRGSRPAAPQQARRPQTAQASGRARGAAPAGSIGGAAALSAQGSSRGSRHRPVRRSGR